MKVNIRKIVEEAVIPSYAYPGEDAGLDLIATSKYLDEMCNIVYGTGLAVEIPEGYVGLLFPRSSNCRKTLWLTNHVGVIDSGYRGEIFLKYRSTVASSPWLLNKIRTWMGMTDKVIYNSYEEYNVGDKVGQLLIIPYPQIEFEEVDFLYPSSRGNGGYGSTGK